MQSDLTKGRIAACHPLSPSLYTLQWGGTCPNLQSATATAARLSLSLAVRDPYENLQRVTQQADIDVVSLEWYAAVDWWWCVAWRVFLYSYKFRVDALLVEAEFDSVLDNVQSGVDAIHFTASGTTTTTTTYRITASDWI